MIRSVNPLAQEPRYELIGRVLRENILSGVLPEGFVLLEGPIAAVMQTSRVPVQSALRQLLDEGLIHRFDGRGYLVGQGGAQIVPVRRDIRELDLEIPKVVDQALQTRGTWRHVYDKVEDEVASCQIFGEFRIVETELADHLGVSRTVVRDVLARLQERGLVRKSPSSHWIAGPLTARTVSEKFQLREIMEPAALRLAGPHLRYAEVEALLERIGTDPEITPQYLGDALLEVERWMRHGRRRGGDRLRHEQADARVALLPVPERPVALDVPQLERELVDRGLDLLQADEVGPLARQPGEQLALAGPHAVDVPGGDLHSGIRPSM